MDKHEFQIKAEQIEKLLGAQDYQTAAKIADTIDWRKIRNVGLLTKVAEAYEKIERYEDCYEILNIAYDCAPIGRMIVYRMTEVALKLQEVDEAVELYKEFVRMAPHDLGRYVLKYKIYQARNTALEDQIAILEEYKSREYQEQWAYELAELYYKAGRVSDCVEECDDLILWFSEGEYVIKAMELKMRLQPLTAAQEEKYRQMTEEARIDKIQVQPVNMDQFNTANLQETLAEGLQDLIQEERAGYERETGAAWEDQISDREPVAADGEEDASESKWYESVTKQEVPEQTFATEDIFGEETDYMDDASWESWSWMFRDTMQIPKFLGQNESGQLTFDMEENVLNRQITGQLSIEDILNDWEEKKRETEAAIAEAAKRDEERRKEREYLRATGKLPDPRAEIKTTVPEEIQRLIEEIEGRIPVKVHLTIEPTEGNTPQEEDWTGAPAYEPEEKAEAEAPAYESEEEIETEAPAYESEEEIETEAPAYESEEEAETEAPAYETEEEAEAEAPAYETGAEVKTEAEEENQDAERKEPEEILDILEAPVQAEPKEILDILEAPSETVMEQKDEDQSDAQSAKRTNAPSSTLELEKSLEETLSALRPGHLSEEQKKLFAYFTSVRGMNEQLAELLEEDRLRKDRREDSLTGNIVITGKRGNGKSTLATDIVKALQKQRRVKGAKMAKLPAESLNGKDVSDIVAKLGGGALLIERAGNMKTQTAILLSHAMTRKTGGLLVILEDEKEEIRELFVRCESLGSKFTWTIEIPVFTNKELVAFGEFYARERECVLDEMAVLALYNRIGNSQTSDHLVNVAEVKAMVDEAIERRSRRGLLRRAKRNRRDEFGYLILVEKDFEK